MLAQGFKNHLSSYHFSTFFFSFGSLCFDFLCKRFKLDPRKFVKQVCKSPDHMRVGTVFCVLDDSCCHCFLRLGYVVECHFFLLTDYQIRSNFHFVNTEYRRQQQKVQMTDKAAISELTWRSLEMQKKAFPGMPHFVIPDDIQWLMRQTARDGHDRIHVMSLGVLAETEKKMRDFLALAKKRKCEIVSLEDERSFAVNGNCENLIKWWKDARRKGAGKVGADIAALNRKEATKEAIEKIRGRWPLPSKKWPTKLLLAEAGVSLNTAKAHLGKRPIAQYNYEVAQKRKERCNAIAN